MNKNAVFELTSVSNTTCRLQFCSSCSFFVHCHHINNTHTDPENYDLFNYYCCIELSLTSYECLRRCWWCLMMTFKYHCEMRESQLIETLNKKKQVLRDPFFFLFIACKWRRIRINNFFFFFFCLENFILSKT